MVMENENLVGEIHDTFYRGITKTEYTVGTRACLPGTHISFGRKATAGGASSVQHKLSRYGNGG